MVKIKDFLKKNTKILTMISTIMICSLVFTGRVNAEEIEPFCSNENYDCFTTEFIDELLEKNNIDTSINNEYLLVGYKSGNFYYKNLYLFNSEDMKNGVIYIDTSNYIKLVNANGIIKFGGTLLTINTSPSTLYSAFIFDTVTSIPSNAVYYATTDILDQDGNVFLADTSGLSEDEKNVINNRTFLEKFTNFSKQLLTIEGSIAKKIIYTPLLMLPFGLGIVAIVIALFYKLFTRR